MQYLRLFLKFLCLPHKIQVTLQQNVLKFRNHVHITSVFSKQFPFHT